MQNAVRCRRPLALLVVLLGLLDAVTAAAPQAQGTAAERAATPLDFTALTLRDRPNEFLVCPSGVCGAAVSHAAAPVYAVPVGQLRRALADMVAAEPRIEVLYEDEAAMAVIQRSAVLRFPDRIDVHLFALPEDRSTLAVYSRSRYGYSDFGVNRARVERWLAAIAARLDAD